MPEMKSKPQYTPEQARVLELPRGEILVSASAGTGKTFLLTRRIVERVLRGELEVDRLLVMTFTDQAAQELRSRMQKQLAEAVAQYPERAELREQWEKLPDAQISTIHSFCLQVLRDFLPNLTDAAGEPLYGPNLQLLDGPGSKLLLTECIEDCLQRRFAAADLLETHGRAGGGVSVPGAGAEVEAVGNIQIAPFDCADLYAAQTSPQRAAQTFYAAVDAFGGDETGYQLPALLESLHEVLRSQPDGLAGWSQAVCKLRQEAFALSITYESLMRRTTAILPALKTMGQKLRQSRIEMEEAGERYFAKKKKNAITEEDPHKAYVQRQESCLAALDALIAEVEIHRDCWTAQRRAQAEEQGKLEALRAEREALWNLLGHFYCFESLPPNRFARRDDKSPMRTLALARERSFYEACATQLVCFPNPKDGRRSWISCAEEDAGTQFMLPALEGLHDLFVEVETTFAERKRKRNAVDFSDYEHLALTLLKQPAVAQYYRERFQEIYVDEYQDTNALQEALIAQISSQNVFRVGDLKQSIYGFRQARPDLFAQRFAQYQEGRGGTLAVLSKNFRSTPQLLAGVNELFSALLTPQVTAGVSYRAQHRLAPAPGRSLADFHPPISVHWVFQKRTPEAQRAQELRYAGDREFSSWKDRDAQTLSLVTFLTDARKRYRWKDMAVLVDTNDQCSELMHKFRRFHIPVVTKHRVDWFDRIGILQAIALLQTLDNAAQDYPLLSLLLSELHPAGLITERDLACIRAWSNRRLTQNEEGRPTFHQVFQQWVKADEGEIEEDLRSLQNRCRIFDVWLQTQRRLSLGEPVHLLLRRILQESPACAIWRQSIEGQEELAAWEELITLAERLEQRRFRGVHAVLRHYEQLSQLPKRDSEWVQETDAVTILTHHSSKGLEFPLVCMYDLNHSFRRESSASFSYHPDHGIGMPFVDRDRGIWARSLRSLEQKHLQDRALTEEKLRLFYVALTRAREELHLFATGRACKDADLEAQAEKLSVEEAARLCLESSNFEEFLELALRCSRSGSWSEAQRILFEEVERVHLEAVSDVQETREGNGTKDTVSKVDLTNTAFGTALSLPFVRRFSLPSQSPVDTEFAESGEWELLSEIWWGEEDWIAQTEARIHMLLQEAEAQETVQATQAVAPSASVVPLPLRIQNQAGWQQDELQSLFSPFVWEPDRARGTDTALPSKTSVSEIKRRIQQGANIDAVDASGLNTSYSMALQIQPLRGEAEQQGFLPAAERGTRLHDLLYHLPFASLQNRPRQTFANWLDEQLELLKRERFLTPDWERTLPQARSQILSFLQSPLFGDLLEALRNGGSCYKEQPFTLVWPEGSRSLIQGRIDLWYTDGETVTLIDYKSDHLPADPEAAREVLETRYQTQLALYAMALRRAVKRPLRAVKIWSLSQQCAYAWPGDSPLFQIPQTGTHPPVNF